MFQRWRQRVAVGIGDLRRAYTWGRRHGESPQGAAARALANFWDWAAPQRHPHVYVVYRTHLCDECLEEHLSDEGCHFDRVHISSSRAKAVQWLQAHPDTLYPGPSWWEVWEEAVDSYHPFERSDDEGDLWYYGRDGEELTSDERHRLCGYEDTGD